MVLSLLLIVQELTVLHCFTHLGGCLTMDGGTRISRAPTAYAYLKHLWHIPHVSMKLNALRHSAFASAGVCDQMSAGYVFDNR